MTEKYFSASFGRFESFFIAYHVELLFIAWSTDPGPADTHFIFFYFSFYVKDKISTATFSPALFSGYFRWAQQGRGYTVGMSCGSQPHHPVSKKTRRVGQGSVWRRTVKVSKELRPNLNVSESRE